MLFGAHISVAGGYEGALDYAFEVGCECAQIFAKSPRQWRGPLPDPAKAEAFVAARLRAWFRAAVHSYRLPHQPRHART